MRVRISKPGLPDGYEISLTGLNGVLLNNQEVEIDDEAVAQFEAVNGKSLSDVLKSKQFGGPGMPKQEKVELDEQPGTTIVKTKSDTTTHFGTNKDDDGDES